MRPQRRKNDNLLPILALGAQWSIAMALIAAIVWSNLAENIKIMMGGGALGTIIGSISTLMNVMKGNEQKHDQIQGNQVNVNPTESTESNV